MDADIIVICTIGGLGLVVLIGTWIWAKREDKRLDKL